jgi:cysteine desulfurase
MTLPVYLDNAATTPVDPRVLEEMIPYFTEKFGNAASRSHSYGWIAEEAVDHARKQVASLIHSEEKEIVFTSGATEANNLALKGVFEMYAGKGNHLITCVTEHNAILDACKHLEKLGAEITYLPVAPDGLVNAEELESAISAKTILISVMYANNEIGVIQPIKEIAAIAQKHNILFHTDATQAVGKVPVDVQADGIHLMSFSAHKLYGPKGIGALYVRRKNPRARLTPQMDGGGHERGMRSGTLAVPLIVGFGRACEIAGKEMESEAFRLLQLRNKLEIDLLKLDETQVNGNREHRLPHLSNISFRNTESEALMIALNKEIAVASGSACTSASLAPSHVLKALGLPDDLAHASIRFSLGRFTTEEEINFSIKKVGEVVKDLRESSSNFAIHHRSQIN